MDELKVKVTSKSYRKKDTDKIRDCTVNQNIYTVTGLTSLLTSVRPLVSPIVSPAIRPSVSPSTVFDSNTDKQWSVLGDLNDPSMGLVIDTESKTIRQQTLEEHTDPKNWNSTICDDCINQFSGWDTECRHKIDLDQEHDSSDSKSVSSSNYHSDSESELDEEQEEIREWIYCLKNELYNSLNSLYAASFYISESDNNSGIDSTRVKQCHLLASDYISEFCNNLESLVYDCYIDLPKRTLQDIKILLNLCQNKCSYALHSPLSLNNVIYNYLSGETRDFRGKSKDFDDVIELFFYDMYPFVENKNNDKKEHISTPILSSIFGSGLKSQTPATIPTKTSEKDEFMKICQEIMSNPSLDNFRKLTSGVKPDLSNKSTTAPSSYFNCFSSLPSPGEVNSIDFLINLLSQYTPSPTVATKATMTPVVPAVTTVTKESKPQSNEELVSQNSSQNTQTNTKSKIDETKKDNQQFIHNILNTITKVSDFLNKNKETSVNDTKQGQEETGSSSNPEPEPEREKEQIQELMTEICENVKDILPSSVSKEPINKFNQCFQESMNNSTDAGQAILQLISGAVPIFLNTFSEVNTDTEVNTDIKLYNPDGTECIPQPSTETTTETTSKASSELSCEIPKPDPCLIGDMSPSKQENDCDLSEKDRNKSVSYSNNSSSSNSNSNSNSLNTEEIQQARELCNEFTTLIKQFCPENHHNKFNKLNEYVNEALNNPSPESTINFISSAVNNFLLSDCLNNNSDNSSNNSVNEPPVPYPSEPVDNNKDTTSEKQESNNDDFLSNLINNTLSSLPNQEFKDNTPYSMYTLSKVVNKLFELGSNNTDSNNSNMKPSWIHLINPKQTDSSKVNDLISLFSKPLPDSDSTTQSATEPATESSIVSNTPSNTSSNTEATTESNMKETNDNSKSEVTITDYDSELEQFLEC